MKKLAPKPHKVAVLALNGVVPFDLSIPCQVFSEMGLAPAEQHYTVRVCGEAKLVNARSFAIQAPWPLAEVARADTIIIPGIFDLSPPISKAVIKVLRQAWRNGARIASICTGAFVLAATGLLDGMRVTTHWLATAQLAARYPKLNVDANVLFVDNGRIITSAGSSAGLDMCLHLVRRDYGQARAARSARIAVAPLEREGGQAQFIQHAAPKSNASLAPLLQWMEKNIKQSLTIDVMANRAAISARTLARRFHEQVGTSPLQWLLTARVRRAQEMLQDTLLSVDEIAAATGFETAQTLRARFRQIVGVPPSTYRRNFAINSKE